VKIAVDVCLGHRGIAMLRTACHEVLEAEQGERDRDWLARARAAGAQLLVSADADIEIFAYDANIHFVRSSR